MSMTDLDEALASPGEATREFYRQQGRQQERERIIKLLEQTESSSHLWGGIGWAIALIKGEK